jgi:hypothetical protein
MPKIVLELDDMAEDRIMLYAKAKKLSIEDAIKEGFNKGVDGISEESMMQMVREQAIDRQRQEEGREHYTREEIVELLGLSDMEE